MLTFLRTCSAASRIVLLALLALAIGGALYLSTSPRTRMVSAQQSTTQASSAIAATTVKPATATTQPVPAYTPTPVPSCTPLTSNAATALDLTSAPAGVNLQNDAPAQYRIYGNTASDLRAQIQRCAPGVSGSTGSEFTGQTDYYLNWQYTVIAAGSGCSLANIRVGLHTTVALPYWQPTGGAVSGLAGRWQTFINGLTAHEQGHVDIDKTYAADLYQDLENLGTIPCNTVAANVQTITSSNSAALDNANDAYDTATSHGATQGAVIPSH